MAKTRLVFSWGYFNPLLVDIRCFIGKFFTLDHLSKTYSLLFNNLELAGPNRRPQGAQPSPVAKKRYRRTRKAPAREDDETSASKDRARTQVRIPKGKVKRDGYSDLHGWLIFGKCRWISKVVVWGKGVYYWYVCIYVSDVNIEWVFFPTEQKGMI